MNGQINQFLKKVGEPNNVYAIELYLEEGRKYEPIFDRNETESL
jgi:hypothetical protein